MKLFFRKYGSGQPLIILHGLFGQSDNWNSLAKQFGESGFEVYTVDMRNHGLSPHSNEWNYKVMSDDIAELISDNQLKNVILLGHSMGGKAAMFFALEHPSALDKLIVVDIAPKQYPLLHQSVIEALTAVNFAVVKTRKDVEEILSNYITDFGTKQFLLKNIYWREDECLAWRFNLDVIVKNIEVIGEATPTNKSIDTPALFIRGEKSNYILNEDMHLIQELFPRSMLESIEVAGHWVHAENPKEFYKTVLHFIK